MAEPRPMQRLLQGDVGSGKTVVAALAILAAVAGGGQAALLVPTELLAEQHYLTFGRLAGALGVEPELLTGGVSRERRARVLAGLADGRVPLVIGTHALLESRVRFPGSRWPSSTSSTASACASASACARRARTPTCW